MLMLCHSPLWTLNWWAFVTEVTNERVVCTCPEINKGECSYLNKRIPIQPFICICRSPESSLAVAKWFLTFPCCFTGLWASGCFLQFWIRNIAQHTYQEVCGSVSCSADSARGIFPSSPTSLLNLHLFIHQHEQIYSSLWVISSYILIISTVIGNVY